jgi:hypothetical protein
MAEQWDLLFTLPNLAPRIPTPFASDGYVICSGNDPRLKRLAANAGNATSLKMLKKFSTAQGRRYRPGCLLIRADIPIASRQAETIRAFRNACAIATTTAFYASRLANPNAVQWHVAWTDQFRFGHFMADQNGWVQTFGGPVMGMDDDIPRQQAAAAFGKDRTRTRRRSCVRCCVTSRVQTPNKLTFSACGRSLNGLRERSAASEGRSTS